MKPFQESSLPEDTLYVYASERDSSNIPPTYPVDQDILTVFIYRTSKGPFVMYENTCIIHVGNKEG